MKILEVSRAVRNPSQYVCQVNLYVRVGILHFMREHPDIGNSKKLPWSIDFTM
jgi:hypothetical protein